MIANKETLMANRPHPLALIILDGWGYRQETQANAIAAAKTPTWDHLWKKYAHTLIEGSGLAVGLPAGQMGNSEVGHLNMGAGRIVHQDLTRIDLAIEDNSFFTNPVFMKAIDSIRQPSQKAVHIMGLLSPGGVHSHEKQIQALIQLLATQKIQNVYIHIFLDGRDTPPKSASHSISSLITHCKKIHCGRIVSLIGRYFAMDRDKRWERTREAYELCVNATAPFTAPDALTGLQLAYARGETDEFVKPTLIGSPITIKDEDVVILMNFRADRIRQITRALIEPQFTGFTRSAWPKTTIVTLTEYDATYPVDVAFKNELLDDIFGEYISRLGLKQLRIAETEKYAHVTFFFNGGIETPFPGEERVLIPSPHVATYDLKPEMSAFLLTDRLIEAINSGCFDVIICNFANPDMVGHTGNLAATIQAIETIDACLLKIVNALEAIQAEAIITSDHGNAEIMFDPKTEQPHTAHTTELVPFIYIGRPATVVKSPGILSDIAPTMLYLMGLSKPPAMTGQSLLQLNNNKINLLNKS